MKMKDRDHIEKDVRDSQPARTPPGKLFNALC